MNKQLIHARLPQQLHRQLKAEAARQGISLNELVSGALSDWIGKRKTKADK